MSYFTFGSIIIACLITGEAWDRFLVHRERMAKIQAQSRLQNKKPIELVEKRDNDSSFS